MDELHAAFVASAPFPHERQVVFDAFVLWKHQMNSLIPQGKIWVNGGFVTHKPWGPPKDIDVAVLCKAEHFDAFDAAEGTLFESLMTDSGPGWRRQPMGGLVDGFFIVRGDVPKTLYWDRQWSGVTDEHHNEVDGLMKGYVEVTL